MMSSINSLDLQKLLMKTNLVYNVNNIIKKINLETSTFFDN